MEENLIEKDYYKRKIIDLIEAIDDTAVLKLVCNLINSMKKKWGV